MARYALEIYVDRTQIVRNINTGKIVKASRTPKYDIIDSVYSCDVDGRVLE